VTGAAAVGICEAELCVPPHAGQKRALSGTTEEQCGQWSVTGAF